MARKMNGSSGASLGGCREEHNLTELRLDMMESFMLKIFSESFKSHILADGPVWSCCKENVSHTIWPLLARIQNRTTDNDGVIPCSSASSRDVPNVVRPPVIITAKRSTTDSVVTAAASEDIPDRKEECCNSILESALTTASKSVHAFDKSAKAVAGPSRSSNKALPTNTGVGRSPVSLQKQNHQAISSVPRTDDTDDSNATTDVNLDNNDAANFNGSNAEEEVVDLASSSDEDEEKFDGNVVQPLASSDKRLLSNQSGMGNRAVSSVATQEAAHNDIPLKKRLVNTNSNGGIPEQRMPVIDGNQIKYRRVKVTHNLPLLAGSSASHNVPRSSKSVTTEKFVNKRQDARTADEDGSDDIHLEDFQHFIPDVTYSEDESQCSQQNEIIDLSSDDEEESDKAPQAIPVPSPHINDRSVNLLLDPSNSENSNDGLESRTDIISQKSPSGSCSTTDCTSSLEEQESSAPENDSNKATTVNEAVEQELRKQTPNPTSSMPPSVSCLSPTSPSVNLPTSPNNSAGMPVLCSPQQVSFQSLASAEDTLTTPPSLVPVAEVGNSKFTSYRVNRVSPLTSITKKKSFVGLEYDVDTPSDEDMQEEDRPATVILEGSANEAAAAVATSDGKKDSASKQLKSPPLAAQAEEQVVAGPPSTNQEVIDNHFNTSATLLSDLVVPKRVCKQKTVYCPNCQASFESRELMVQHRMAHHLESDDGEKNATDDDGVNNNSGRLPPKRKRRKSTKLREYELGKSGYKKRAQELTDSDSDEDMQDEYIPATKLVAIESEVVKRQKRRIRGSGLSSSKPYKYVACPRCGESVSKYHRYTHLRIKHGNIPPEEFERLRKMEWEITYKEPEEKLPVKRGRPGRPPKAKLQFVGALTDTEGQGSRKRISRGGAVTDWNSSDEEPIIKKKERSKSLQLNLNASSGDQDERNTTKIRTSIGLDGASISNTEENQTLDNENEDRGQASSKKMKMTNPIDELLNPTPGTSRALLPRPVILAQSQSEFRYNSNTEHDFNPQGEHQPNNGGAYYSPNLLNQSVATDILGDEEDGEVTRLVDSTPASQASTVTTISPSPGEKRFKTPRVPCDRCGTLITKHHLEYHRKSTRCIRRPLENGNIVAGDDSQTEPEDDFDIPSLRGKIPRSRVKGKCLYCKREMLRTSLRNHVYKACAIAREHLDRGEKLDYTSQAEEEDSQGEEDEEQRSKLDVRTQCQYCGLDMNANSLYKHQKLRRCKALKLRELSLSGIPNSRNSELADMSNLNITPPPRHQRGVIDVVNYYEGDEDSGDNCTDFGIDGSSQTESETQEEMLLQGASISRHMVCRYADCGFISETEKQHQTHLQVDHLSDLDRGVFPCENQCGKIFLDEGNMKDHLRTHRTTIPIDYTGVSYKLNKSLQPVVRLPKPSI